jgi:hypothetical protein
MSQSAAKQRLFRGLLRDIQHQRTDELLQGGLDTRFPDQPLSLLDQLVIAGDPELRHRYDLLAQARQVQCAALEADLQAEDFSWELLPVAAQGNEEDTAAGRTLHNRGYRVSLLPLGGDWLLTLEIAPRYWRRFRSHPQLKLSVVDAQGRHWLPPTLIGRLDGGAITVTCDPALAQAARQGLPSLRLVLTE